MLLQDSEIMSQFIQSYRITRVGQRCVYVAATMAEHATPDELRELGEFSHHNFDSTATDTYVSDAEKFNQEHREKYTMDVIDDIVTLMYRGQIYELGDLSQGYTFLDAETDSMLVMEAINKKKKPSVMARDPSISEIVSCSASSVFLAAKDAKYVITDVGTEKLSRVFEDQAINRLVRATADPLMDRRSKEAVTMFPVSSAPLVTRYVELANTLFESSVIHLVVERSEMLTSFEESLRVSLSSDFVVTCVSKKKKRALDPADGAVIDVTFPFNRKGSNYWNRGARRFVDFYQDFNEVLMFSTLPTAEYLVPRGECYTPARMHEPTTMLYIGENGQTPYQLSWINQLIRIVTIEEVRMMYYAGIVNFPYHSLQVRNYKSVGIDFTSVEYGESVAMRKVVSTFWPMFDIPAFTAETVSTFSSMKIKKSIIKVFLEILQGKSEIIRVNDMYVRSEYYSEISEYCMRKRIPIFSYMQYTDYVFPSSFKYLMLGDVSNYMKRHYAEKMTVIGQAMGQDVHGKKKKVFYISLDGRCHEGGEMRSWYRNSYLLIHRKFVNLISYLEYEFLWSNMLMMLVYLK